MNTLTMPQWKNLIIFCVLWDACIAFCSKIFESMCLSETCSRLAYHCSMLNLRLFCKKKNDNNNDYNNVQRYQKMRPSYFICLFVSFHWESEVCFRMLHFPERHTMPIWHMFKNDRCFRMANNRCVGCVLSEVFVFWNWARYLKIISYANYLKWW